MCFSAQASIVAGLGLISIGSLTLKNMKRQDQLYLKLIPFLFGIQQLCEAIVWVTIYDEHSQLMAIGKYGFLFFAFVVWPLYVPLAVLYHEKEEKRRRWLSFFSGIGAVISLKLAWDMLCFPIEAVVSCNHIQYTIMYSTTEWLGVILYCIATIVPFFVAKQRYMHWFGLALLFSVVVSAFFYAVCFTSVWCFFAALLSFFIYKID